MTLLWAIPASYLAAGIFFLLLNSVHMTYNVYSIYKAGIRDLPHRRLELRIHAFVLVVSLFFGWLLFWPKLKETLSFTFIKIDQIKVKENSDGQFDLDYTELKK